MSWKNASWLRFKPLSITTNLTLLYSLSTFGLLVAIGLFLYPTFVNVIKHLNHNFLSHVTTECYEKVVITLLLSSFGTIMIGHITAQRGLKRLYEFAMELDQITAQSLSTRLDLNEWPKELEGLGIKFNNMLDRIQNSFLQLSQFSADIAHELRTPINNLQGITELALTQEKKPEEYQKLLITCMDQYRYLAKIIENLLFLARADHKQFHLQKILLDPKIEILNICDYYQALADEKHIEIICYGNASLQADPTLFKRTISNLLINALTYTLPNGQITINIQPTAESVKISISDTGCGIDENHIPHLFNRFYRVDPARDTKTGGLGLGLAIVKSILDLHQGKILVTSQLTVGTTVSLDFPKN